MKIETCYVCQKKANQLICSGCDRHWHRTCHGCISKTVCLRLQKKGGFVCKLCKKAQEMFGSQNNNNSQKVEGSVDPSDVEEVLEDGTVVDACKELMTEVNKKVTRVSTKDAVSKTNDAGGANAEEKDEEGSMVEQTHVVIKPMPCTSGLSFNKNSMFLLGKSNDGYTEVFLRGRSRYRLFYRIYPESLKLLINNECFIFDDESALDYIIDSKDYGCVLAFDPDLGCDIQVSVTSTSRYVLMYGSISISIYYAITNDKPEIRFKINNKRVVRVDDNDYLHVIRQLRNCRYMFEQSGGYPSYHY